MTLEQENAMLKQENADLRKLVLSLLEDIKAIVAMTRKI